MLGHFLYKGCEMAYYVERDQWNIDNHERLSTNTPYEIIHNLWRWDWNLEKLSWKNTPFMESMEVMLKNTPFFWNPWTMPKVNKRLPFSMKFWTSVCTHHDMEWPRRAPFITSYEKCVTSPIHTYYFWGSISWLESWQGWVTVLGVICPYKA